MAERKIKCTVRDGRWVEPCDNLLALIDGRRVQLQRRVHMPTGEPTRSFVTIHSGEYAKGGLAMNVCPMCGEHIDAPHGYEHTPKAA